jgi:PAS domain S-box-containing protein
MTKAPGKSDESLQPERQPQAGDYLEVSNVFNSMPSAAYVCDMAGIIRKYNEAAVQLWGRQPARDEHFSTCYKLYNEEGVVVPHDQMPIAECLTDGLPKKNREFFLQRPGHSRIYIRENVVPVVDNAGKQVGAINCLVDISNEKEKVWQLKREMNEAKYRELTATLEKIVEKKTQDLIKKTEELKKSEERYHKMVEEVEDYAILLLDKDGIIMNWNKGAEKIKGYKEEEILGKSFQEFYLPADRARGLPLQLLSLARNTGKALHEGWRKRKDGSAFWGSIVLTAVHDDQGQVIGFTKVTRDLTERKLAEDRMKEYLGQLEFQNKELEQFVYAASHDLKEPLRKIHLYNSYIADNTSNRLDKKSVEYLARSIKATERMKSLIEDLLIYSRSTFSTDNYEPIDLNLIIEEVKQSHKEEIAGHRAKFIVERLPVVQGVTFQMQQLFFNLINNSFKYKHPHRNVIIKITCELVNGYHVPAPNLEKDKQYYKISVIDNGIGFHQQYVDRIFEIFQRLNNSPSAKGSGIGLAICKKIIQNYKGYIQASGKPGVGACFTLYLPKD